MSNNAFSSNPSPPTWADQFASTEGNPAVSNPDAVPGNPVASAQAMPRRMNLGSGKSWHPEFFNVDINAFWKPDLVADFGQDFSSLSQVVESERFGQVQLKPGSFELIAAHDVLEHVNELTQMMTNCLELLEFGGMFDIIVPYDLSYGAWQDPTHVRAFNERSWLYYTDWFWYLGWADARFEIAKLDFTLSERGKVLAGQGMNTEELAALPRAIDSMRVLLRKIPLSEQDRQALAHHQKGPSR